MPADVRKATEAHEDDHKAMEAHESSCKAIQEATSAESSEETFHSIANDDPRTTYDTLLTAFRVRIIESEQREDFRMCLNHCDLALKLQSDSKEFEIKKAKFLVLTYKLEEANEILNRIVSEHPENAEAISIIGLLFYFQGNLSKAIEVCICALSIDPTLEDTRTLLKHVRTLKNILRIGENSQP